MFTGHNAPDSGACSCSGKAHHGITGPGCGENNAPGSEHITSGAGEKQTHTAELRTSLQKEDRLLRAEEQGIIDQGARTAIRAGTGDHGSGARQQDAVPSKLY